MANSNCGHPATVYPTTRPWQWFADSEKWFESLIKPLVAWEPDPELALDVCRLKLAIAAAIDRGEHWMRHPCVSPLTLPYRKRLHQRTFQLAVLTSRHQKKGHDHKQARK